MTDLTPLILTNAPNGATRGKAEHPALEPLRLRAWRGSLRD